MVGNKVDPEVSRVTREDDGLLVALTRFEHNASLGTIWNMISAYFVQKTQNILG